MSATVHDLRHMKIAQAAYYRAKSEGFPPGREMEHWLEAERELDYEDIEVPESLAEG